MAHTNLGNALDAEGRLDEAAPHYEEAARLNPTYPEALNNLGTLEARRGQMEEAEKTFQRALAVRPAMTLARYNLGLARSNLGRPIAAATEWMRLLAADPRDARAGPSLNFVVDRVLLPGCSAGTLTALPDDAELFVRALSAWPAPPADGALRASLVAVAGCLDTLLRAK